MLSKLETGCMIVYLCFKLKKLLSASKKYGADVEILNFENINTESIKVYTNLIVWKNDATNITDLPIIRLEEFKYQIIRKNLKYINQVTYLDALEMSDEGNFINEIVRSIELEGKLYKIFIYCIILVIVIPIIYCGPYRQQC